MCRLAAFPPFFSKNLAYDILKKMEGCNKDGTGSVYVKDGEFIVNKLPLPLDDTIELIPLLEHMPGHDGWTVVHLRAATHGGNEMENTHPFIKGPWSFVHNGVWSDHKLIKAAFPNEKWEGQTDSEVAAHLFNVAGVKSFCEVVNSGVFLALNINGELTAVKASGQLEMADDGRDNHVLASDLKVEWKPKQQDPGWIHFDKHGKIIDLSQRSYSSSSSSSCGYGSGYSHGGAYGRYYGNVESTSKGFGQTKKESRREKRERKRRQMMMVSRILTDGEDVKNGKALLCMTKDGPKLLDIEDDKPLLDARPSPSPVSGQLDDCSGWQEPDTEVLEIVQDDYQLGGEG